VRCRTKEHYAAKRARRDAGGFRALPVDVRHASIINGPQIELSDESRNQLARIRAKHARPARPSPAPKADRVAIQLAIMGIGSLVAVGMNRRMAREKREEGKTPLVVVRNSKQLPTDKGTPATE
jgi:hypothetical protein